MFLNLTKVYKIIIIWVWNSYIISNKDIVIFAFWLSVNNSTSIPLTFVINNEKADVSDIKVDILKLFNK